MEQRMATNDTILEQDATDAAGGRTIGREAAIAATRDQLGDMAEATDEEIWSAWQATGGGPTNRDDLLRVVAQLEGIAVDG